MSWLRTERCVGRAPGLCAAARGGMQADAAGSDGHCLGRRVHEQHGAAALLPIPGCVCVTVALHKWCRMNKNLAACILQCDVAQQETQAGAALVVCGEYMRQAWVFEVTYWADQ